MEPELVQVVEREASWGDVWVRSVRGTGWASHSALRPATPEEVAKLQLTVLEGL